MPTDTKLAVVTGARGGIGSEICKRLARNGCRVIMLDRSSGGDAADALEASHPGSVAATLSVDLANHLDIARVCNDIRSKWNAIDYLFNNAGVLPDSLVFSTYGNELDFEVNALAPLQMMDGLRSLLSASRGTIVNTSAGLASGVTDLRIDDLRRPQEFTKLFGPYSKSKQALNVLTAALAREFDGDGITVRAVDPGPNRTRLTKGSGTPLWMRIFSSLLPGPNVGARRIVDGALSPSFARTSGVFITGGKIKPLPEPLADERFQADFLTACRDLVRR